MANQRMSFVKREREMKLKDKARAKAERRAAKRAAKSSPGGPEIADGPDVSDASDDLAAAPAADGGASNDAPPVAPADPPR